jgi:hypothetical protein
LTSDVKGIKKLRVFENMLLRGTFVPHRYKSQQFGENLTMR